jgi:hypothetical protein
MSARTVYVSTDVAGDFEWERALFGIVRGIAVELGTLTTPDIVITDDVWGTSLLDVSALAADAVYQPGAALQADDGTDIADTYAPAAVMGRIKVVVSGAGSLKTGRIHLLLET